MARYIDAEKLIEKINSRSTHLLNEWDTLGVLAVIDETPTADVEEVRHAEWITSEPLPRTYGRPRSMCSRCGAFARYEMVNVGVYHEDLSKRCPECGAKMGGGKNEKRIST